MAADKDDCEEEESERTEKAPGYCAIIIAPSFCTSAANPGIDGRQSRTKTLRRTQLRTPNDSKSEIKLVFLRFYSININLSPGSIFYRTFPCLRSAKRNANVSGVRARGLERANTFSIHPLSALTIKERFKTLYDLWSRPRARENSYIASRQVFEEHFLLTSNTFKNALRQLNEMN